MSDPKAPHSSWRTARWVLVGILAITAVIIAFAGLPDVCEDQLAQVGNKAVVQVCNEPSLTDIRLVAFILLILLLLWPDLSELTFGIVTLKRRVEETATETKKVGGEIKEVGDQVKTVSSAVQMLGIELRQTISQQVSQTQNFAPTVAVYASPTGEPQQFTTAPAPSREVPLEVTLRAIVGQSAYQQVKINEARQLLNQPPGLAHLRTPRVAVVGAAPDPRLRSVAGLAGHIENTHFATGAGPSKFPPPVDQVAASSIGHILAIAPSALILPIAALGLNTEDYPRVLQEAIAFAAGWRANVVLLAFASDIPIPGVDEALLDALDFAFVVAPAGNGGVASASWPGRLPGIAAVAAVDQQRRKADFSNYGRGVDVAAPGVEVNSLIGLTDVETLRIGAIDGTSVSADIVAGIGALLLSGTGIGTREVLPVLRSTSVSINDAEPPAIDARAAAELAFQVGAR